MRLAQGGLTFWLTSLLLLGGSAYAVDPEECGDLANGFGPFDYRTASQEQKNMVEGAHFTRDIENLKPYFNVARGMSAPVGGDIDYTLRVFPNHERALLAMVKLSVREKKDPPEGARLPVACYFERALRFKSDDGAVRLIHGIFLIKQKNNKAATAELDRARELIGDEPNLNYNLGLAYFDLGNYERSLEHAKQAYSFGFPLPGLREKLKKVGRWQE
jgi:tetratricopeptide (TPR) repeat protein